MVRSFHPNIGESVLGRAAPSVQLMDAGVSLWSRTAALSGSWGGRGFLSANASLAIRLLARRNSVAKQDPALLRQL